MSDDNRAQIVLDGDVSPLKQKMREASEALKQFGTEGEGAFGKMTGPLEALQSKFIAIGAILAGGAVFREGIQALQEQAKESRQLAAALGITADEAGILSTALGNVFLDKDSYLDTVRAMTRGLNKNGEAFEALGIKTRDSSGRLLPMQQIIANTVAELDKFTAGADRNAMAQQLVGRGYEDVLKAARLTGEAMAEARDEVDQYHKRLDPAMIKAYRMALENFGDGTEGVTLAIGRGAMPVLTQLAEWFSQAGPAATEVTITAMNALQDIFTAVRDVAVEVWGAISTGVRKGADIVGDALGVKIPSFGEIAVNVFKVIHLAVLALAYTFQTAFAGIQGVIEVGNAWLVRFASVAQAAMTLDWSKVSSSWEAGGAAVEAAVSRSAERIRALQGKYATKFEVAAAPGIDERNSGSAAAKPGGGNRASFELPKEKEKADKDQSFMATYEARLAEIKNVYEQENTLRNYSKAQELAYWRELQQGRELNSKDTITIAKRTATLELEIRRESAKKSHDFDEVMIDSRRATSLEKIDLETQSANFARDNGETTKMQLLEQEEQFARRRFEIEYRALLERQEMAKNDPNTTPAALQQIKEQMLQVERAYQLKKNQIGQDKKKEGGGFGSMFEDAGQAFGNMARNLITSATTLRQQLAQVFQSIYQSFIVNLVTKPFGEWLASQARMLAVKMGFMAAEKGLDTAAAASTVAIKGTETIGVVANDAIQAGTGAAKSQAGIPVVGPILAIAAMAAIFGAVMAMGSKKSASRGFDIPKGLNPLTQLHEEEMVLPAKHANVIRNLADGGGSASSAGGGDVHMHVHTQSTQDFARFLKNNSHTVAPALRAMARNFTPVKGS